MTPILDFIVVLATLKNGKTHQVLLQPDNRLAVAKFICQLEGSIRLEETPLEGLEIVVPFRVIPDISKLKRDQVVPLYADHIRSNPPDDKTVAFNQAIIEKWSNSALVYIKEKAWKLLEK